MKGGRSGVGGEGWGVEVEGGGWGVEVEGGVWGLTCWRSRPGQTIA